MMILVFVSNHHNWDDSFAQGIYPAGSTFSGPEQPPPKSIYPVMNDFSRTGKYLCSKKGAAWLIKSARQHPLFY